MLTVNVNGQNGTVIPYLQELLTTRNTGPSWRKRAHVVNNRRIDMKRGGDRGGAQERPAQELKARTFGARS